MTETEQLTLWPDPEPEPEAMPERPPLMYSAPRTCEDCDAPGAWLCDDCRAYRAARGAALVRALMAGRPTTHSTPPRTS